MNARDTKHIIIRRLCLEKAKKKSVVPGCFVLLNYCMVEKENKTFSLFQESIQNAATDLAELLPGSSSYYQYKAGQRRKAIQTLKISNKLMVQE